MTVESVDRNLCVGCGACANACARGAVAMMEDADGFLYPQMDAAKCVDCGLCATVCPVIVDGKRDRKECAKPLAVYAARAKETDLRMRCASGGVFSLLAQKTVSEGGVVFGVVWDRKRKIARFACAQTQNELVPMRDSKYVQSDAGNVYREVRAKLKEGRSVLFSGTPCQIYALNSFLHGRCENLTTVEVICMGVPSVKLLTKTHPNAFADETDEVKVIFRNKFKTGWLGSCLVNGPAVVVESAKHGVKSSRDYYRIMAGHHCQRESCYCCIARGHRSGADLTIGDFWNVARYLPEMDDDKGTSLVLVNTKRGELVWKSITAETDAMESDYETALAINHQLVGQLVRSPQRAQFSMLLGSGISLSKIAKALEPPRPLWRRIASRLKRMVLG